MLDRIRTINGNLKYLMTTIASCRQRVKTLLTDMWVLYYKYCNEVLWFSIYLVWTSLEIIPKRCSSEGVSVHVRQVHKKEEPAPYETHDNLHIRWTRHLQRERTLLWCNDGRHRVTNHQRVDGLFNRLFRHIKENIKAPHHWPLWGDFTGDRWNPLTNGQ